MLTKEYDLKQNEALILNEILNQQFWTSLVLTIHGFIKMETIRFFLGLSSHSRIFHSYGDVTITVEGLQILTYASFKFAVLVKDPGPGINSSQSQNVGKIQMSRCSFHI